jgi:flagellar operon protein
MLYQDLALIASVVNKTIITAMKGDDMKEHVFTNIDSAVIIR